MIVLVQPDAESAVCIRARWKTLQGKMYKMWEPPAFLAYRFLIREATGSVPMAGALFRELPFAEALKGE